MKVFVAGASGAIGRPVGARLTRAGHEVAGMVRSAEGAGRLRRLGAEPVQVMVKDAEGRHPGDPL
jgi:2-alkyl-3-oxoalkanoate reductase